MAKPLSFDAIQKRAGEFVAEWHDAKGEEKQEAQSFVRDLLRVYGVSGRTAAFYEKRAKRTSTGRGGFIDTLVPGKCLIEMKSRHANLADAERQALDYVEDLPEIERPRYIITSDFGRFRILDVEAPSGKDVEEFDLADLTTRYQTFGFLAGYEDRRFGSREQESASIEAARLMADLYDSLGGSGYDDHEASVFLVRTLFCLYADDAGLWERGLFWRFVEERTAEDGSDLGGQLTMLYQAMNKRPEQRQTTIDPHVAQFPYVNGDLFAEPISIPAFDESMRVKLIETCIFDWRAISPAIFGSLFQAVKDKDARRTLGEHYTTETNILKTINPLFMDELRGRFARDAHDVTALRKLRADLARIRVIDPACGCGNFLIIAYREMRALDLEILVRLRDLGDRSVDDLALFFTKENLSVTLDHFAGIEKEDWPARIAATALHLVDHQANLAMQNALGSAPDALPLDKNDRIHVDNALSHDWTDVFPPSPDVVIVGNPPFLGHETRDEAQARDLRTVWGRDDIGRLDYVTGWYKKAIDYFRGVPGGRFAFVSTNSVTQGEPVPALFRPVFDAGWRIRFAHRPFAWSSEAPGAAAVHCVVLGFDRDLRAKTKAVVYTYDTPKAVPTAHPVGNINAYLADGPNVLVEQRRSPLAADLPPAVFGNMPRDGGHLIIKPDAYETVMADPVAAKYVRRFVGSKELIHGLQRWCLWLVDLDPSDISRSPVLRERLDGVRSFRIDSKAASTQGMADTPHLFGQRSQPTTAYLCIPSAFSERRLWATCDRLDGDVIVSNLAFHCADPDGFAFAIISSSMYLTWQESIGGRLESRFRFSNTIVWNNLPLPPVDQKTRQAIIRAGQGVLDARSTHPERTLADHYNPLAMDPVLVAAHRALDRVIDRAFGAKKPLRSADDRRDVLIARYADLTTAGTLKPSTRNFALSGQAGRTGGAAPDSLVHGQDRVGPDRHQRVPP